MVAKDMDRKIPPLFGFQEYTFNWDLSLTVGPENQFWNNVVGIGSPNIPNFVAVILHFAPM